MEPFEGMFAKLLAVLVLALSGQLDAGRTDPLSQCTWMSNPKLAPFLYLSQSEIAVIGHYSGVNYDDFKNGRITNLHITPACYIKGYKPQMEFKAWSGFQKCKITPLSGLLEYPSLFFLRRDNTTNRWIMLNSGEYQHQVDTKGLLFGVDNAVTDFPEVCGLQRRRMPIDQSKCETMICKGYCSFRLAPKSSCKNKRDMMLRYMKAADIPRDVAPFDGTKQQDFSNSYPDSEKASTGSSTLTEKEKSEPDSGKASDGVQATGGGRNAGQAPFPKRLLLMAALFCASIKMLG